MSQFPDYYSILGVSKTASQEQIRQAYRKESLKYVSVLQRSLLVSNRLPVITGPIQIDWLMQRQLKLGRLQKDFRFDQSPTQNFLPYRTLQAVADAYYVLSNPERRREYDHLYQSRADRTTDPQSSSSFFSQFAGMFGASAPNGPNAAQPDANGVFTDVFDEVSQSSFHSMPDTSPLTLPSSCAQKSNGVCRSGAGLAPSAAPVLDLSLPISQGSSLARLRVIDSVQSETRKGNQWRLFSMISGDSRRQRYDLFDFLLLLYPLASSRFCVPWL